MGGLRQRHVLTVCTSLLLLCWYGAAGHYLEALRLYTQVLDECRNAVVLGAC